MVLVFWYILFSELFCFLVLIFDVFDRYILEAKELPMLSMLERIKSQIMTRNYNKQKEEKK
jgi:hypothetical protein